MKVVRSRSQQQKMQVVKFRDGSQSGQPVAGWVGLGRYLEWLYTSSSPSLLIYVHLIDIYEHNTYTYSCNVYCCISCLH